MKRRASSSSSSSSSSDSGDKRKKKCKKSKATRRTCDKEKKGKKGKNKTSKKDKYHKANRSEPARKSQPEPAARPSAAGPRAPARAAPAPAAGAGPLESEEILAWDRTVLTRRDFRCLAPGCLLNDSVLDFFLRFVHRCLAHRSDVYVFSSLFFTQLMAFGAASGDEGWENVKGWTKRVALFSYRYLLLPVNSVTVSSVRHWWLAVVKLRGPSGRMAPSVVWLDSNQGPADLYAVVLRYLRGYLRREWAERPASRPQEAAEGLDVSGLGAGTVQRAPAQQNAADCGVFLVENALRFLSGGDGHLGSGEAAVWCDQECALKRRGRLKGSLERLAAARPFGGAGAGRGCKAVPDILEARPDLTKWLLQAWSLPPSWPRLVGEVADEEAAAAATAHLEGIWVREGHDLAGEFEAGVLRCPKGDAHAVTVVSRSRFKVTLDREYTVLIGADRLFWADGDVWKRLVEEGSDLSASSDESGRAAA